MGRQFKVAALAGVLATLPGLALAESSVTISGFFKVGLEDIRIGSPNPARTGNTSETRVTDNNSRIVFGITEDVGNGLQAIAQLDSRFSPDSGAGPTAAGNTWVGLSSPAWGNLTFGRWDLHYGLQPDDIYRKAGSDKARSVALFDFVQNGPATQAIANATRTPNVVRWQTPNWSGFELITAYSTNGTPAPLTGPVSAAQATASGLVATNASEADLASTVRKGYAWNLNPSVTRSDWQVGYSYWNSKPDASLADQRGDTVYGFYKWSGLKIGLGWNNSKLKSAAGIDAAKRDAWTVPLSYSYGAHNLYAHYTWANDDKIQGANTGANMFALSYVYDVSKRTSLGLTYARIRNDSAASYQLYTDNGGSQSSLNAAPLLGEDPQLFSTVLKHAF